MSDYKVMLLGAGGVGKTCIAQMFVNDKFIAKYNPTIEDTHEKTIDVDGNAILLNILDTAGQDEFSWLRKTYMSSGQGFIFVYAVDDYESFRKIKDLHDDAVQEQNKEDFPKILVGNKTDLADEKHCVPQEEAEELAAQLGCSLVLSSARQNENIDEIFLTLSRKMMDEIAEPENEVNVEEKGFFAKICNIL
eukprot:TRINITY_DN2562_c0_g1_i1.p1 TRINITY_DN2562_c0_g1~~TRINITY_DN2562_c0_g1_i1.p1  ORF type:complete len:192 (+),score=70.77 TRINITY_DN2562_c0_g1_i1:27-602(+)